MINFTIISAVLTITFILTLALVAWLKYREHLHAHRRERDEHHAPTHIRFRGHW
jgi:hypothetical protein